MRPLRIEKIPRPPFDYSKFDLWLSTPHKQFVVEIGCGVGTHAINWAKINPDSKILAIERTIEKFKKLERRALNHPQLKNIFIAHADANHLLPHLDIKNKVDQYLVLYPNPYPKNKHKNLRYAHSSMAPFLANTLTASGRLTFATNLKFYADELVRFLPATTNFRLKEHSLLPLGSQPRTLFEKKYLSRGEQCHNLVFGLNS